MIRRAIVRPSAVEDVVDAARGMRRNRRDSEKNQSTKYCEPYIEPELNQNCSA